MLDNLERKHRDITKIVSKGNSYCSRTKYRDMVGITRSFRL